MNSAVVTGERTRSGLPQWCLTAVMSLLMAACGGGGGSSGSNDTTTPGVVVEAAPLAVSDVSATASGTTIQLNFTVSNPQNVSAFETICTGNGPSITTRSAYSGSGSTAATATVSVTGVTNASSYSCTVSAINSSGASTASSAVHAAAGTPAQAVPNAPDVLGMAGGPISAVLSFTESDVDGGSAVSSYIGICLGSGGDKVSYSYAAASPIIVLGLEAGKPYTCWVSGLNAQGSGKASASYVIHPTAAVAVAADAPAAPTGVAVTHGNGSASVAFNTSTVQASATRRRAQGTTAQGVATESGVLYRATCSSSDGKTTVSVESPASPITVPQLTNGSSYSCTVTATTVAGLSADSLPRPVIPGTVPDAPTLTGAIAGDTTAELSFTPPGSDGGRAISGYRATCASDTHTATGVTPDAGSVLVAGLVNGSAYRCSIAAVNEIGPSTASNLSPSVTPVASAASADGSFANTPTVQAATTGNGSATFSATADSSSPVQDYTATCTSVSTGQQVSATSPDSPITVTGLANGSIYSCAVTARTKAGNSDASVAQAVTPAATAPDAPTLISTTPGNAAITVAFTPGSDGGSAVTVFTATCGDKTGTGPASPVTVSGLTNGQIYSCSVTATNAIDTSPASATDSTRPRTAPQAPTATAATAGDAFITVNYTAPADNGGADISSYTAACVNGNKVYAMPSKAATDTSITVAVPNDATYDCTVTARNTADASAPSNIVQATPAAAIVTVAPDAATNLQMTIGDSMLTVSFDRPASNGADVSYALICSPGDINKAAINGSATATGLTNGTSYSCLVRAIRGSKFTDATLSAPGIPNAMPTAPTLGAVVLGDGRVTIPFTALPGVSYSATCGSGSAERSGGSYVVTGLSNGQNYTCSVTASNSAGGTSSSTLVTLPAAPTTPVISNGASGNGSATLTFSPNSDAGITYTATCGVKGETAKTNTDKSITVSGLTNGSTYSSCTVTATNQTGVTVTSLAKTVSLPAAPTKPVISTAAAGNGSATLTFSPNSDAGITYTATCGVTGETAKTNTDKSITVSGLTNGSTYSSCTVTATNQTGVTVTSLAKTVSLPAAPTKPVISTAAASNGSVTLTFSPNSDTGITYSATCGATGETTTKNTDKSITVSGLTNGSTYSCTVTATANSSQLVSTSSGYNAAPFTTPGAPTSVAFTNQCVNGTNVVRISFGQPATDGGSAIDLFKVVLTPYGKPESTKTIKINEAFSAEFTVGQSNFTAKVTAHNKGGDGTAVTISGESPFCSVPVKPV